MIQYPYAYNDKNELIHISSISKENKNNTIYRCPCCNHEMKPRAIGSKSITSHFYHLPGVEPCSLESYLHKTAKEILYNRFKNKEDKINIEINNIYICDENCNEQNDLCKIKKEKIINLNEIFNLEPKLETYYNGFKPDILLESSDGKVLFIEICYTHKCEEEKINSGIPIIEIYIDDEKKLELLEIKEIFTDSEYEIMQCKFINFKNKYNKNKEFITNEILKEIKQYQDGKINNEFLFEGDKPYCIQSEKYKREHSLIRRLILYDSYKIYDYGIFNNELNNHKLNALMDITYNKYIIQNPRLILSKYNYKARSCINCDHYICTKYEFCNIGKNGTSRKNTFDILKAINCKFYDDTDALHYMYELWNCKDNNFTYEIWINEKYKNTLKVL